MRGHEAFGENGCALSRFSRPFEIFAGIFRSRASRIEGNDHIPTGWIKQIGQRDSIDIRRDLRDVAHQHISHVFIQICIARIVDICANPPHFPFADGQAIFQIFLDIFFPPFKCFNLDFVRRNIQYGFAERTIRLFYLRMPNIKGTNRVAIIPIAHAQASVIKWRIRKKGANNLCKICEIAGGKPTFLYKTSDMKQFPCRYKIKPRNMLYKRVCARIFGNVHQKGKLRTFRRCAVKCRRRLIEFSWKYFPHAVLARANRPERPQNSFRSDIDQNDIGIPVDQLADNAAVGSCTNAIALANHKMHNAFVGNMLNANNTRTAQIAIRPGDAYALGVNGRLRQHQTTATRMCGKQEVPGIAQRKKEVVPTNEVHIADQTMVNLRLQFIA